MANSTAKHKGSNSVRKTSDQIEQLMEDPIEVGRDVVDYLREYAKENPETAALWCFGIGFVLGWKLKIW